MSQHDPQHPARSPASAGPSESVRVRLRGSGAIAGCASQWCPPWSCWWWRRLPCTWVVYRFTHSITDDAFVETHVVNIAPQEVSGHLVRYLVQEHDVVAAGQLLAEIDPVPYREQVALLEAKLGVAQAQLAAAKTSLERLQAQVPREIEVAQQALAAAKAEQSRDEKTLQFTTEDVEKGIHEARSDLEAAQRPARARGKGPQALCRALRERGRHAAAVAGGDPDVPNHPGGGEGVGGPAGAGAGGREEGGGGPAGGGCRRPPGAEGRAGAGRWP